jgi:protein-tyrosine phosphatase
LINPAAPYTLSCSAIVKRSYQDWLNDLRDDFYGCPFAVLAEEQKFVSSNVFYDVPDTLRNRLRYTDRFLRKGHVLTENEADFIDASIVGSDFIACSAPTPSMFRNWFYQLFKTCDVVVMLTPYYEANKLKAHNYLGSTTSDKFDIYADMAVKNRVIERDTTNDIVVSEMIIRKYDSADITIANLIGERLVYHIHYNRWSDFHVPNHAEFKALNVIYAKYHQMQEMNSMLGECDGAKRYKTFVHCSGGVGRSGTFVAIQYLLRAIKIGLRDSDNNYDAVTFDIVDQVRKQRVCRSNMVQTADQFKFIYNYIQAALNTNDLV